MVEMIEMLVGDQHQIGMLVLFRGNTGSFAAQMNNPVTQEWIGEDLHTIHLDHDCCMADIADKSTRFQRR